MSKPRRDDINRSMRVAALWIGGGGIVVALFVALVVRLLS